MRKSNPFVVQVGQLLGKVQRAKDESGEVDLLGINRSALLGKANAEQKFTDLWTAFMEAASDETTGPEIDKRIVDAAVREYLRGTDEGEPIRTRTKRS